MKGKVCLMLLSAVVFFACTEANVDNPTADPTESVINVQLQNSGTDYKVDLLTVYLQKADSSVITAVTDINGVAGFTVTETGTYTVMKVEGADASSMAVSSTSGREFVKTNPISDPYPLLEYSVSGISADVSLMGETVETEVTVPKINKVSPVSVESLVSNDEGDAGIQLGTADFSGRIIMSNCSVNDDKCSIVIQSDVNRMVLYLNASGSIRGGAIYGIGTSIGVIDSYTSTGPVSFEITGTDDGDWAMGCNLSSIDLITRELIGGKSSDTNMPVIYGGAESGKYAVKTYSTSGGTGHVYSLDVRILKFDTF